MRRIFVVVIVVTITIALAWWLAGLPGSVTATLAGTTITTATPLALVGVALLVLVLVMLLRLLGWLFGIPQRMGRWRGVRRRQSGDTAVTRTLVAIAAGAERDAWRESGRARRLLGDTPQTLLLAAEAGRLGNREADARALYNILAERHDAALLGLRGLFRQAMNRQDWDEATAIARRAEALHPGGAWLRDERAQLAMRTGNWVQALRLAGADAPRAALATAAAEAEPDAGQALRLAKQAWKENQAFAPAALAYARRLRATGREVKAFNVIREAWRVSPQPELAAFWLDGIADPAQRLREAARIAVTNPDHAESHLVLARASLAAGQPAEARQQLADAQQGGINQQRLWLLMADLEAAEGGETEAGQLAQRDALRRAATADPDPHWRCDACGSEHAHWLPACPVCHTPGRIRWGIGALQPLMLPTPD